MKVEPKELLNIIADSTAEIVQEHSELSEQALTIMKMLIKKTSDKLFKLEVSDMGLSEEEIDEFIATQNKESELNE